MNCFSKKILTIASFCFFSLNASTFNSDYYEIKDLVTIPQKITDKYFNLNEIETTNFEEKKDNFIKRYFKPWNLEQMSVTSSEAQWGNMYKRKEVFNSSYTRIQKSWFNDVIKNANFEQFNTLNIKAITTSESILRVFPSTENIFYNPSTPGEGYPFDYNINSAIKTNIPLNISHYSKDLNWAYVESNVALGWIKVEDIAIVDDKFIKNFMSDDYVVAISDNTQLRKFGYLYKNVKLGTILPRENGRIFTTKRNDTGSVTMVEIDHNEDLVDLGVDFTIDNIKKISKSLLNEPYGWGGINNLRDCSLLTKDFFIPFGIFLDRNSRAQKDNGTKIKLYDLNNDDKKKTIIEKGIPFLTLVYMKGHIMLYVGHKNGEPLIMHNFWSVKYKDNPNEDYKRRIVGKGVITTLEPGKEIPGFSSKKSILNNISYISIL